MGSRDSIPRVHINFAPAFSFAHILQSRTPIDDLSSPTRYTSKHLPILTIFFSFERSKCATLVILFFMSFCSFLAIQAGLQSTIHLRLRVTQVSTFLSLPSFSVLNGRIDCSLFMSFAFSLCTSSFVSFYSTCHCMFWVTSHT